MSILICTTCGLIDNEDVFFLENKELSKKYKNNIFEIFCPVCTNSNVLKIKNNLEKLSLDYYANAQGDSIELPNIQEIADTNDEVMDEIVEEFMVRSPHALEVNICVGCGSTFHASADTTYCEQCLEEKINEQGQQ